jgi:NADP-dependent 3-hydroxy acid dehydrogenase YdfG
MPPAATSPPAPRTLITGCSSGIGRALVSELTRRGHRVIASARQPELLADLACEHCIELDVTSEKSVGAALGQIGEIDILVNNAGISMWGPVELVPVDAARRLFDTNVFGAMRLSQAVLPTMRARRTGLIVQISSAAGRSTSPLVGYYSASKHALEAASEALRLEVAAFGVRVTCISLGAVTSSLGEKRSNFDSADYLQVAAHFRARLMSKRRVPTSAEDAAAGIADAIADGGKRFRYDVTEDSKIIVARRRSLSDEAYEAELLEGLVVPEQRA